ncbi:gamma-glutamylcyclotransferase family protein [Conexibacter sp. CPCC 206217]|uniref:gamma-glutamylcyclotransferase family protein n=1 Tax=Conexibacter sp. CPCC 206217 TaxID=3064574 RepID=UPI00272813BA|nr:gamma-glutamylcyclotransferase family protein [Conexibacter sp. CPCC 206217]MDO8211322.1 gamma-glutamylcyclotransferase family protein [Conexibacter sp. CPCC 206217]
MPPPSDWVFAYGSLAAEPVRGAYPAVLAGHRRRWGVAMDNRCDLPGYKWYRARASGERPDVYVAFLDLVADADGVGEAAVNGLCLPVDATALALLDARERNYERIDVSALVTPEATWKRARVWAYAGRSDARERLARGVREGRAVVSQEYVDDVEHGFRRLGGDQLARYRATTDPLPPGCERLSLERIDLR